MADELTFEQKFEYICIEVENGKALRKVCRDFMGFEKFYSMINENEVLAKRYARACEARADKIFDDMLSISDNNENDVFIDDNGIDRTNHDVIQRSKLMVDTRKWYLSKLAPKKYGDKIDVTSDGEKIAQPIINIITPNDK
jgi:hypothetical protein